MSANLSELKQLLQDQLDILSELQELGYNVVTCGNCGKPFLMGKIREETIICPYCFGAGEQCDMPDLFY